MSCSRTQRSDSGEVRSRSARCYHIIMARMAIGLGAENGKKKVLDLDALRKDTPPRKLKKILMKKAI